MRRSVRVLLRSPLIVVLGICLQVPAGRAATGDQDTPLSLCIAMARADEVLTGRLVAADIPADATRSYTSLGFGPFKLSFIPVRIWKGTPQDTFFVYSHLPHPDLIELGTDHLVLIDRKLGYPRAEWYRDVIPIADAGDARSMLDSLNVPASPHEFDRILIEHIASGLFSGSERDRARYRHIRDFADIGKEPELVLSILGGQFVDAPDWERSAILDCIGSSHFDGQGAMLLPLIRTALRDASPDVRLSALMSMRGLTDSLGTAAVLAESATTDPHPWVRATALFTLAQLPADTSRALAVMARALEDTTAYVRKTAVQSLGRVGLGSAQAETAVRRACHDPDPLVRSIALGTITEMLGPDGRDALEEALNDPSPEVRRAAVEALTGEQFPSHDRRMAFAAGVADPDPEVKGAAASFLRWRNGWEEPWAVSDYLQTLRGADSATRRALLGIFQCCSDPDTPVGPLLEGGFGELLVEACGDTSSEVRSAVMCAVRVVEPPEANLIIVLQGMEDPDPEVRGAALRAVSSLKDETRAVLPRVITLLDDGDRTVRRTARAVYRHLLKTDIKP